MLPRCTEGGVGIRNVDDSLQARRKDSDSPGRQSTYDTECCASLHSDTSSRSDPFEASGDFEEDVWATADELAAGMAKWNPRSFELVKELQKAPRNYGIVTLMRSINSGGAFAAVKKMPASWVTSSPSQFRCRNPKALEQPWFDIGMTEYLHARGFPTCDTMGVYSDEDSIFVVRSFATKGDLLALAKCGPDPGHDREAFILPIVKQLFEAVKALHDLGVVHRDLSLENVVATDGDAGPVLQLIDFGMATCCRQCSGACGKAAYTAPEMRDADQYDGFLSDAFACGVMLFILSGCAYPWDSTAKGASQWFEFARRQGLRAMLAKKKFDSECSLPLAGLFSEPLIDLLEGLLAIDLAARLHMGELCHDDSSRSSLTATWFLN